MPGRWKLTAGAASAQEKADRLRMRSDKLARQATAWETGAEREPLVRRKLADLPAGYTVLHDLVLPGENARLDHLVISPGGLYLVDAKKYSGRLMYSKKMLWHGRFPIVDKLETLTWEADALSDVLGHDVVPVMCFVDAVLPQPVATIGSVIACRTSVLHTIVRSTHATMSANEVARILETAQRLTTPRRSASDTLDPLAALVRETDEALADGETDDESWESFDRLLAGDTGTDADGDSSGDFAGELAGDFAGDLAGPATAGTSGGTSSVPAISTIPPIGPDSYGRPEREPRERRWPRRLLFVSAAIVGVAVAAAIVWAVSRKSERGALEAEKNPPSTTAAAAITVPDTVEVTTTTVLDLTASGFSAYCPSPGAGWSLRPVWPGDVDNLAWYDFAFQDYDGTWKQFALMTSADTTSYVPTAIPPANARTVRIRQVFADGTIGTPRVTTWTAPDAPC